MKLGQVSSDSLRPHLLALSSEIDDLPDVGPVLEQSGLLDNTADGGTPNSLKSFDASDFAIEDCHDVLPFDGLFELPGKTSSTLALNLLPAPSGGTFCSSGEKSQAVPSLAHFPPESVVQKQGLLMYGGSNLLSANLLSAPLNAMSQNIILNVYSRHNAVSPNNSSKFLSSVLSGNDNNSNSCIGKYRPSDGSGLGFPNNRDAPEYQRVMDILTEYHVQVAEKSAEALMPCKRRKSRPLVETTEVTKSSGTLWSHTAAVSSARVSPRTCLSQLPFQPLRPTIDQRGDLSNSDSVASNGSIADSLQISEQNSLDFMSGVSRRIVTSKPVTSRALDVAIPQAGISQGAWRDKIDSTRKESIFPPKLSLSGISSVVLDSLSDKSREASAKGYRAAVPECHCSDTG